MGLPKHTFGSKLHFHAPRLIPFFTPKLDEYIESGRKSHSLIYSRRICPLCENIFNTFLLRSERLWLYSEGQTLLFSSTLPERGISLCQEKKSPSHILKVGVTLQGLGRCSFE
jgi:hypothetical protein